MSKSNQGMSTRRYQIVPRTLIFIFDQNGRVLLLKGAEDKRLWAGLFNGIGGHVEPGEDILEAAYRELSEETGIEDVSLRCCGQILVDVTPEIGVGIFVFRGDVGNVTLSQSDEGELHWVRESDLATIELVEDLHFLLPLVREYKVGDPLIVGKYAYNEAGQLSVSFR